MHSFMRSVQIARYLNRRSMEDDSSAIENKFAFIVGCAAVSLITFSLLESNGLPLNTGLNRSIMDISSSVMHGASIKLKENTPRSLIRGRSSSH